MDRRRGRDSHQARAQAEDGSARCAADPAPTAGRSFLAHLGAQLGESGSAATALAPSPHGAGAYPDHEPVASRGPERRTALQEGVMGGARTTATGIFSPGSVGEPATARSAGTDRSTQPDDYRTEPSHRTGSREVAGSAATDDPTRSRRLT